MINKRTPLCISILVLLDNLTSWQELHTKLMPSHCSVCILQCFTSSCFALCVCCLSERTSLAQHTRIGLSLEVSCDGGDSSFDKAIQLLCSVAWTQASLCLLMVLLAFCLSQLIECEMLAGLSDMKDNTQSVGRFLESFFVLCLCFCMSAH